VSPRAGPGDRPHRVLDGPPLGVIGVCVPGCSLEGLIRERLTRHVGTVEHREHCYSIYLTHLRLCDMLA
jgi:hypothetical protein